MLLIVDDIFFNIFTEWIQYALDIFTEWIQYASKAMFICILYLIHRYNVNVQRYVQGKKETMYMYRGRRIKQRFM